ncbi:F-box protein [Legionella yabuuchiae]|uniref:F-box protein n=1 Tax=Legionella yabuuchiae TaxID=376727 RepID=UPI0010559B6C|nr:F-box protein [Legionella yabuuchiae]
MPTQADESLYKNAVKWVHDHPQDTRISENIKRAFLHFNKLPPKNKVELITALLKTTGLPEEIKQSLPYLSFDLDALPDDMLLEIKNYLNKSDIRSLESVSKRMNTLFQRPKRLLDKFLQRVAYGEQDKVEALFTEVYRDNEGKKQEALLHQGRFTDYSGRTFNCSAYEYAYWAKDTYMCRMLERYMDDATKASMLERVNEIEHTGLSYTQDGTAYCTPHFDFTPLIQALQSYVDNYEEWYAANNTGAIRTAWLDVGKAQRNVPAHVAQEYCRRDRSFDPRPEFNEATLPRVLTFYSWVTGRDHHSWFPLTASNSSLGFDFALIRGEGMRARSVAPTHVGGGIAIPDLEAIIRLNEVRTIELTQSREHLNPPAMSHSTGV